ncbi:hypothetical protein HID58_049459 [Brassica napus]|uniref:Uncharacterized protein n=1 Tax=Brassica napus TaxID=3708 RepID=A0ABQ8B514_BRANA|nr:hypothetical protein HID58_049459 [Brassica napus]
MSLYIIFNQWRENSLTPFHKSVVETIFSNPPVKAPWERRLRQMLEIQEQHSPLPSPNSSKILCPGDNPQQVKQRLRHWAQAAEYFMMQSH